MIKDTLHTPFELVLKDFSEECPRGEHTHSFFELVYVVAGTGKQRINNSSFRYQAGHLFLLAPADIHCFDFSTPTQLFFIRFNNIYLQPGYGPQASLQHLEMILKNASHEPGCVLKTAVDKTVIKPIMQALIHEHTHPGVYHQELINQYIHTILIMVARNLAQGLPAQTAEQQEDKAVNILQYVQANIYHPEKLRAEHISQQFGISETYLGRYFKKHANETLQQYILHYKLKLIENRLLHTPMRVTEIADEFGFTDKSHLNRLFKKYKGSSPREYRKQQVDMASASPLIIQQPHQSTL